MEVLVELKASVEPESLQPSIGEDDIKDYMDMLYISRNLENIRDNSEIWRSYNLILSIAPLFLGSEDGITRSYEDISTSLYRHAEKFVHKSKENIDGHDISCKC